MTVLSKVRASLSKPSPIFWALVAFIALLFFTGGASRIDVQSLVILRPVSIIVCALALMTLRREHLVQRKLLLGSFGAVFVLALLHVVPLPPALWHPLAGREDLLEVEKLAGLYDVWRPLTLAPINGWHALLSLFVPLAILLLGIQLNREDLFRLLPVLIALVGTSGLLGLLQAIGDPQSALYFYRITNSGSAVGLFANRNHAATLLACLFPALSVYVSTTKRTNDEVRLRQLVSVAIAIVLVPLVLVTGSRSGLVCAIVGIIAASVLYRRPRDVGAGRRGSPNRKNAGPILGGLLIISLGFLTFFFSRAEAIERLFAEASNEDSRTDFWLVSLDLFWRYFPWGSGSGSFVEAFQIAEPNYLLDATYLNRAHNDWVEIAVTFGLPGVVGLFLVSTAFFWRSYKLWRNADANRRYVAFGRLASVCIAIIAIASVGDYPLRTPTIMGVFAILALWFTEDGIENSSSGLHDREGI